MNSTDSLECAEGFFGLGMFVDAWNELEELTPEARVEPLTLELRLRILTALEKFDLGEHVAGVLISSDVEPERCRETVARFHYARALALSGAGKNEEARLAINEAINVFPDIKAEIVEKELLA